MILFFVLLVATIATFFIGRNLSKPDSGYADDNFNNL